MRDLMDRLDSAIDGTCPCGAEPRPGSAYCSYDCEPTHRSVHTTAETDGTQMRWRPDLLTAHDDSGLSLLGERRRGRFNAAIYSRGSDSVHLRLDDGHRYAGCDVATSIESGYDGTPLWEHPRWKALERELTDSRRAELVSDPWSDLAAGWRAVHDSWVRGQLGVAEGVSAAPRPGRIFVGPVGADLSDASAWTELGASTCDGLLFDGEEMPAPTTTWSSLQASPLADMRALMDHRQHLTVTLTTEQAAEMMRQFTAACERLRQGMQPLAGAMRAAGARIASALPALAEPQHPMLRAIEQRRTRNTGPERRPRAPRQLNPHGAR